jgi:D-glycero-D-manno-heptose 1,7-bisphosphate phosphatase
MLRPALFLDRDGVINVDKHYVHRIEDFEFVDGIFDLCAQAKKSGMALVVVTNQAGIGRGYYTERQFWDLTEWMCAQFANRGVSIDRVYFCPNHPQHGIGVYQCESFDRKPNPGMILRAQAELGLDLTKSILIGDKVSDMQAAHSAGIGRAVLLGDDVLPDNVDIDIRAKTLDEIKDSFLFA